MIHLGQIAPDFVQDSTQGPIRLYEWLGDSWGVLFSHPRDFTPVCTTELGEVARLAGEWAARNVKVIGLSVDPVEAHLRWVRDIEETQKQRIDFPIIADCDRWVSSIYGMVHCGSDPETTVRTVFVIDPAKKVRLMLTYPPSTGRNFAELIRAIDSLQLSDRHAVATPAGWAPGEEVLISPKLSDEEATRLFPQGFEKTKSYLRTVRLLSDENR